MSWAGEQKNKKKYRNPADFMDPFLQSKTFSLFMGTETSYLL